VDQVAIRGERDGAGAAIAQGKVQVEVDALVRIGHRQYGKTEVLIKDSLTHVEDQRRRHGAVGARVRLRGKGAEGDEKAPGINAALHPVHMGLEEFRQVDADGRLNGFHSTKEARLLYPVTAETQGSSDAQHLALPTGSDPG